MYFYHLTIILNNMFYDMITMRFDYHLTII